MGTVEYVSEGTDCVEAWVSYLKCVVELLPNRMIWKQGVPGMLVQLLSPSAPSAAGWGLEPGLRVPN